MKYNCRHEDLNDDNSICVTHFLHMHRIHIFCTPFLYTLAPSFYNPKLEFPLTPIMQPFIAIFTKKFNHTIKHKFLICQNIHCEIHAKSTNRKMKTAKKISSPT